MNNNKGLWIPIDLILNKNITFQEKIILVEINQLTMLDKGCIASNRHFSELFQIKRESISRSISSLENKGYITSKIRKGSRNFDRTITINNLLLYSKQIVKSAITNCLESKENNTFNNTINNIVNIVASQEAKPTVTRSLKIIDLANIPELTQDKVILDMPTENQIDAIKTITKNYEVDGSKLFDTIMELSNTKADYFEDFNQILAIAINQQLGQLVQAKERETEKANCKYKIDFRATEMANDERNAELDDSQNYAVDHNLQYLQKVVGKKFDFDELKGWVSHALLHGYKGIGFQKALSCIVKAIKDDKFTRPYSFKENYLPEKLINKFGGNL